MGVRLRQAGFEDFVLLEKGRGVGGTWYHKRYPGCACDLQSAIYPFSFEIKKDWSRPYASQPEILKYMEDLAAKYDLLRHVRFGTEVTRATWDDERACWTLTLGSGETLESEIVVSALIEYQVDYALRQIEHIFDEDLAWIDVRPDVMNDYNDEVQRGIAAVRVWNESCPGYYRSATGRVVTQWPFSMSEFRERTRKPDADAYETKKRTKSASGARAMGAAS